MPTKIYPLSNAVSELHTNVPRVFIPINKKYTLPPYLFQQKS